MSNIPKIKKHTDSSVLPATPNTFSLRVFVFWFLPALFYTYQMVLTVLPGVIAKELIVDFSISATSLGALTGVYFLAYSSLLIPIGLALDRFGVRRLIPMAIALCSFGAWLFSVSSHFSLLLFARVLIGMGASGALLGTLKITTMWFPKKITPIFTGLAILMGSLGGYIGNKPVSILLQTYSWREVVLGLSILGAFLSVISFLVLRDNEKVASKHSSFAEVKAGLLQVIKSPQVLLIASFSLFIYLPRTVFADQWGNLFLQNCYKISREEASSCIQMLYFGLAIGGPAFGLLASVYSNYRIIFRTIAVVQIPLLASIIWIHLPTIELLQTTLLILGFFLGAQALKFNAAFGHAPPSSSGSIVGFVNTLSMFGGYLASQLIGLLLDLFWDGTLQDGHKIYSEDAFAQAFGVFIVALAFCFFSTYYIKNKQEDK